MQQDRRETLERQVQQALRALQGLKAYKVMLVLRDLRVQREQPDLQERQALWVQQEPLALQEQLEPQDQ